MGDGPAPGGHHAQGHRRKLYADRLRVSIAGLDAPRSRAISRAWTRRVLLGEEDDDLFVFLEKENVYPLEFLLESDLPSWRP